MLKGKIVRKVEKILSDFSIPENLTAGRFCVVEIFFQQGNLDRDVDSVYYNSAI